MTTKILHQKANRYLCGAAMPAETRQIQAWLSSTDAHKVSVSEEEKTIIEDEILEEVKSYTAYPLFYPKEKSWWKKFTAVF
jgi:hypothetical protein